jgi:hypothetical protein
MAVTYRRNFEDDCAVSRLFEQFGRAAAAPDPKILA